ncbi:MAG: AMP-binding protein [Crocinitomicaceae bacterium]
MRFCFDSKEFIERTHRPDALAVVGSDFSLTWTEFEVAVEKLKLFLEEQKIHLSPFPVILYGHKSANMLVAMYACMRAEIAYIPIDEIYPMDRIQKVKEIGEVAWVLNTTNQLLSMENTAEIQILQHEINCKVTGSVSASSLKLPTKDPIVYIIFTSGSTGEPKGVQISSEAVQSFTRWMCTDFGFSEQDVFINTAVLSFDLSVFEVMTFGAIGGTILLNDKATSSQPSLLVGRVDEYKGTVWVSTPSFAIIYARLEANTTMKSIHTFLFCGEVLPNPLAKSLLTNFPTARVLNTYGPTEATVAMTLVDITEEILEKHNPLPVGKCKAESEIIFEDGEIILKGSNVSIGYLNRPELNAEKFIILEGQRAFKTGDEGFLKEDMLFFSGRNDDLVKLHGYRIELNEINATILKQSCIENAATIALKRNGEVKKIVSLVQFKVGMERTKEALSELLAESLPVYMIPSDFKTVQEIPLNQNGKADRNRLTEIYMARD